MTEVGSHTRSAMEGDTFHRISFAFSHQALIGSGLGPVGTSFSSTSSEYRQLAKWESLLKMRVAPELPPDHRQAGHWYRRHPDGEGVLLRRIPDLSQTDGREDKGRAVLGAGLNAPAALLVALGAWPDLSEWLNSVDTPALGWESMPPYLSSSVGGEVASLDQEAAAQEKAVLLISCILRERNSPIDVVAFDDGPLRGERERLLLLWGVYRTLRDVLGNEQKRIAGSNDWSFSTYEPWPVEGRVDREQPRFAFRPPTEGTRGGGAQSLDLTANEYVADEFHEIAVWLVTELGKEGAGELGEGGKVRSLSEKVGEGRDIDLLRGLLRLTREGRAGPSVHDVRPKERPGPQPVVKEPPAPPRGEERRSADEEGELVARRNAQELARNLGWERPEQHGNPPARAFRQESRPVPFEGERGARLSPHDAPSLPRNQGYAHVPQTVGTPGRVPVGETVSLELQRLLERLRCTRDPREIARVATEIVVCCHPGFGQALMVCAPSPESVQVPRWVVLVVLLLQVVFVVALILSVL